MWYKYYVKIRMREIIGEIVGLKSLYIYHDCSTRHLERNFSFSIHILFDNWVRNSLLLGSFRTSEGTKPRCSSTLTSSFIAAEACWLFPDFSWFIVEDVKCRLNPRKELVCFPTFCLKTLKDSDVFPVLLVTTAILTQGLVFQKNYSLLRACTSTVFVIIFALFH